MRFLVVAVATLSLLAAVLLGVLLWPASSSGAVLRVHVTGTQWSNVTGGMQRGCFSVGWDVGGFDVPLGQRVLAYFDFAGSCSYHNVSILTPNFPLVGAVLNWSSDNGSPMGSVYLVLGTPPYPYDGPLKIFVTWN